MRRLDTDAAASHGTPAARSRKQATPRGKGGTGTLVLALQILEHLAQRSHNASLGTIAKEFSASKATVYRHLRTLAQQGFVHQDPATGNYEVGIKLVVLGEAARGRFDIVRAARDELIALRDETQQAATICSMVQDSLVVLDLIQGHTVIEFGTRPGTRLALDASAHGKVWLAFSSSPAVEHLLTRSRACKTPIFVQELRVRSFCTNDRVHCYRRGDPVHPARTRPRPDRSRRRRGTAHLARARLEASQRRRRRQRAPLPRRRWRGRRPVAENASEALSS